MNNLLRKLEKEAPTSDNAQLVIQFNSTAIEMKFKMFIYYGFISDMRTDEPSDEPAYIYSFQDEEMQDTKTYHKWHRWEIMQSIDTYTKLASIEWVALDYEDYSDEEGKDE